jgi:hypothetical protein
MEVDRSKQIFPVSTGIKYTDTHFSAEHAATIFQFDHVGEGIVHQAYLAQHVILSTFIF